MRATEQELLFERMRTPLVRSDLACVVCVKAALYLCTLCPNKRLSLCHRTSCALRHAMLKHEHPTPAGNDLPEPKRCPVCGKPLSPVFQIVETIKSSWRRLRHVCTRCKVAVVLHRLSRRQRSTVRPRKRRKK